MAITTAEAFLAVLEKSGLLSTEQFVEAQDATLLTSNASELAEMLIRQDLLTPWQSTQLLAGRSALFLGNYALMDLLGRGGMGSVFLARHRTMDRRVALKVVSKQVGKDPASLERFLAEARLIASLDHPNIVQAYDVDKESDRFYIVMEYIEGQDLDVIMQEHGLFGFEDVADCVRQAADGLAHAHGRNMIHCDIKPSNLLLSDQGVIKILDMGMARLAGSGEDSGEQVDHKVLGTIDYMSPEQAMEGPDFDHRADIYSLGCTLYFLLTGHPPFDEGTLTQRIVKHQTQSPPDILATQPDTPQELVDICMKMMAKDPADRYQSAAEVSCLLTGWHEPIPSDHAGDVERLAGQVQPQGENSQPDHFQGDDSAIAPIATNLAMDELQSSDMVAVGPALQNKKKRSWSEEQQTVVLVAVAVLFAIVALSVALIVVIFKPHQTVVPAITKTTTTQGSHSSGDENKPVPQQPPAKQSTNKTPPASPKQPAVKSPPTKVPEPNVLEPTVTEPKATEPNVLEPTVPDPKVTEPKVPEPKAPKPKDLILKQPKVIKPKPIKPKPEPVDPFNKLPSAVDLHLLADTVRQPQTVPHLEFKLATLHPDAASILKINLVGGGSALPHGDRFLLLPVDGDNSEPAWLIRLDHSRTDKNLSGEAAPEDQTDVARIWFVQDALMFEWLGDAIAASANHLKNCVLDITIDGKTQSLALSRPRVVAPLTPDLNSGTAAQELSIAYLPNVSNLRLAVTDVESSLVNVHFDNNIVIEARGREEIDFKQVANLKRAVVRVSYEVKAGRTRVTLTCLYQLRGQDRLRLLREAEWKQISKAYHTSTTNLVKLKEEVARQEGRRSSKSLAQKKRQLEKIENRVAELKTLLAIKAAVHGKGKLFFREYILDKGRQIELSTTDAPNEKQEGNE